MARILELPVHGGGRRRGETARRVEETISETEIKLHRQNHGG